MFIFFNFSFFFVSSLFFSTHFCLFFVSSFLLLLPSSFFLLFLFLFSFSFSSLCVCLRVCLFVCVCFCSGCSCCGCCCCYATLMTKGTVHVHRKTLGQLATNSGATESRHPTHSLTTLKKSSTSWTSDTTRISTTTCTATPRCATAPLPTQGTGAWKSSGFVNQSLPSSTPPPRSVVITQAFIVILECHNRTAEFCDSVP